MMKVFVDGAKATVTNIERLTSGMVGKKIQVVYSEQWDGLTKTATFTNEYDAERDAINPDGIIEIPHEVLHLDGKHCKIAFYGYTIEGGEKNYALPTIYADLGLIEKGAKPSAPTATISPTIEEQLQADIADTKELAEDNASRIDGNDTELADHEQRITELEEHGGGESYDDTELRNRIGAIEGKEASWNAKYSKPTGGIPKIDLASAVQTSLGKADSAVQPEDLSDYAEKSDLEAYAKTKDVPTQLSQLSGDSTHRVVTDAEKSTWNGKQNAISDLETIRSNASDAKSKAHTHSNKTVIDGITSALVTAWNTASTWITTNGANVLSHIADTVKHITADERTAWNAKYSKPSGGIPKNDLASAVQTSLGRADTALQQHQDISGKENTSNKVTSISSSSTDTQYPTAKAVYAFITSIDGNGVAY